MEAFAGARARHRRRRHLARALAVAAVVCCALWVGRAGGRGGLGGAGWLTVPAWAPAGAAVALVAAALLARPGDDPERWARGAAGERATAQLLATLSPRRWVVLHDLALPGARANVDHLVIGPTGLWVVDSKAYRGRLEARRRRVLVSGHPLETAPARFEASVVAGTLGWPAKAVVAVHGEGLPRRGRRCDGVRVVPATALLARLTRGSLLRPELRRAQVRRLAQLAEQAFGPAASCPAGGGRKAGAARVGR